jgi:hypothetical protein
MTASWCGARLRAHRTMKLRDACILRDTAKTRLRQGGAKVALGLAIVGGSALFDKEAASYRLVSAPAKSSLASLSHEIQVCNPAEKPEFRFGISNRIVGVGLDSKLIVRNPYAHGVFGVGIKNSGQTEVFGESIIWRDRKLISKMPTDFNLSERGFCSTAVNDMQIMSKATIEVLRNPISVLFANLRKMEIGDLGDQNRQFDIDSSPSTEIGGNSGDACGAGQAYGENTEDSRENGNDNRSCRCEIIMPTIDQSSYCSPKRDYFTGGAIFLGTLIAFAGFAVLLQWQFAKLERR